MTTSLANNLVFRGFFEKQKLTGPNFIDWYRQLKIVLSIEDKLNYLEQQIPPAPVAPAGQHVAPEILAAHNAWIKGSKEIAGLILIVTPPKSDFAAKCEINGAINDLKIQNVTLMTMEPKIQRNLEPLHAHEMLRELKTLFAQQAEQELLQTTRDFHSCRQKEGQSVSSYVLKMSGHIDNLKRLGRPITLGIGVSLILIGLRKEYDGFVQNYNMHNMGKTLNELHAMLKLHEQTLPKNNAPALQAIRVSKVQKVNKHKKWQTQMAARAQNHGKGKNKKAYAPKPKIPSPPKREYPTKDSICHEYGEIGHWKRNCPQYLAELLKKKKNVVSGAGGSDIFVIKLNTILNRSWIYDTGCGTHICNTTHGLRASRKLNLVALNLYVGNGQREAVEAIGAFHLCLPSGFKIVLNNCHYAPSITRGVISVCTKMVLLSASFIYAVSNKRAKLDLDSALLWHCRLRHISKKRIEKLQHDGLLDSSDLRAFEKCVSCMSGKMARKSYTHQVERANYLLILIHTNVCGSFKIISRQGASYFVTFTDDFSRYGYVNLLKHKHEVFETFKVFQKEVENQLGKTIKSLRFDRVGEYMSQEFLNHLKDHGIIAHRTFPYTPQHNGYPKETMGYSFYYPPKNKVLVARNTEFLENNLINQEASGSLEDLEIIQEEDTNPSIDTRLNHEEDDLEIDEPQSDIIPIRRSTRTQHAPDRMCLYIDAEEHELGDLVELPPNGKTIGSKWLFKKKTDMDGVVHTYKARLMAKGYTQTLGIDYEETFSPVADIRAIRILIAIAAYYDYEILQMDVKTAFLNGFLNEEVYMEQPKGFVNLKYPNRRYCMENFKRGSIPMQEKLKLSKSQGASTPAELKRMQNVPYASAVGFIMYAVRCTRLDVAFAQNVTSCFQQNLGDLHWTTVKNIMKYLRNTKDMFLVYGGDLKRELRVSCYNDVGYLTDANYLKSQTGYVFVLNGDAVRKFISELGVIPTIEEPISMYCDNTGAIDIANESGITKGARHFRAKVHYLREVIEYGDIKNLGSKCGLVKAKGDDGFTEVYYMLIKDARTYYWALLFRSDVRIALEELGDKILLSMAVPKVVPLKIIATLYDTESEEWILDGICELSSLIEGNSKDAVSKVSTSIFVTNFPDSFSAKDLFHTCKVYGHVVDSFIRVKRTKGGKRFGFVRFINVFSVDRLVNNLCTIWMDRLKLHANVARFQRLSVNEPKPHVPNLSGGCRRSPDSTRAFKGDLAKDRAFASVVEGCKAPLSSDVDSSPTIVLDEDCLNTKELSCSLMGKVKEFSALSNIKNALSVEGFSDITIQYMGEFWILLDFSSPESKEAFIACQGACSWFSMLRQASSDFVNVGRIMWVEVEVVPFSLWSENSFRKIAGKWGELLDVDDLENTCYHSKHLCVATKAKYNVFEIFKITFRGNVYWIRAKEVPGWVLEFLEDSDEEIQLEEDVLDFDDGSPEGDIDDKLHELEIGEEPETVAETVCEASEGQNANQSPDPFEIYDLLNKKKNAGSMDQLEDSTHEYPPGFTPNTDDVNAEGNGGELPDSVGNSGGILCAWDPKCYCKSSSTVSNSFVIVRGVWLSTGVDTLLIVVDAPHDKGEKRLLWEYLFSVVKGWKGDVIMTGDFNEVCFKIDRFGSIFHARDAEVFNDFISNSGLEEVSAITLDRYLSDHRPILLRESVVDYGPSPFKFYHHWLEVDGFRKFMEYTWNAAPSHNLNDISNLMLKLKFLKSKIKEWNSTHSRSSKAALTGLMDELHELDIEIDKGSGFDVTVAKRLEVVNSTLTLQRDHATESLQKAKVKWSVEGDENSRFFHGLLNKKRRQLSIRGVMKDGVWVDNPSQVKAEFLNHFTNRFSLPSENRIHMNMSSPNTLTYDHMVDLDSDVSREEVKRAVWDCGTDKSPCPICDNNPETTSHLFFQCPQTHQLYKLIARWWDVELVDFNSYEDWLSWIVAIRIPSKLKAILDGVFYVMWWSIWSFRNKLLFSGKIPQKATLFDNIVSSSFHLCRSRCNASFSWNEWLKNPYLIIV
nr:retrotransposon protein, putative, Ty1-copia subclass [Tanacetum cinerariifolium]